MEQRFHLEPDLLGKVSALFETDGGILSLEAILTGNGFGLPIWTEDGYHFTVLHKYMHFDIHYVDCLAEEILLLHRLKLLIPSL